MLAEVALARPGLGNSRVVAADQEGQTEKKHAPGGKGNHKARQKAQHGGQGIQ